MKKHILITGMVILLILRLAMNASSGVEPEEVPEEIIEPEITYEKFYTEEDVLMIAKVLYTECRGEPSVTEQACVAWTILNRVDGAEGNTVANVVTAPNQFAYSYNTPVWDNLYWLAEDVLERWSLEKNGETEVGRVLPPDYKWFVANKGGLGNVFRNSYSAPYDIWDFSLPSPYEN